MDEQRKVGDRMESQELLGRRKLTRQRASGRRAHRLFANSHCSWFLSLTVEAEAEAENGLGRKSQ